MDSLEERLKSHAKAFDGLLSLIPAKHYYGEDHSDQWQKKKQTKEQKRAAKIAKLDPDNAKSAKDVLDEQAANARKRRREEEGDDLSEVEGITREEPLGRAAGKEQKVKKQKTNDERESGNSYLPDIKKVEDKDTKGKKDAKTLKQQEKAAGRRAKAEQKAEKVKTKQDQGIQPPINAKTSLTGQEKSEPLADDRDITVNTADDFDPVQLDNDFEDEESRSRSTTSPSPAALSSTFDPSNPHSGSSSISSIAPPKDPPSTAGDQEPNAKTEQPLKSVKANPEELRARLQQRIEQLRAARKADGAAGETARTRQELMESRRQKEEQRKAHRKELRRKAKEEERRRHEESLSQGSPLLSGSPLISPGSPTGSSLIPTNFSFGRINFGHGQRATSSLDNILAPSTKVKGPSDPRTALQAVQKQEARLAALDPAKRTERVEKDAWLHAKQRAEGTKVRDDTSLLKKTLKRKEKQKKKSEREWDQRITGVEKGKAARQQKREANLAQRREEKGSKKGVTSSAAGAGGKKKKAAAQKKNRPGFEGTFRAKPRRR